MGLGSFCTAGFCDAHRLAGAETIWFTRADRGRFYSIVKDPARPTADLRRTAAAESVRLWDGDAADGCGDRQGCLSDFEYSRGEKAFWLFSLCFHEDTVCDRLWAEKAGRQPPKRSSTPSYLYSQFANGERILRPTGKPAHAFGDPTPGRAGPICLASTALREGGMPS
jgi:hypothetical protein